MSSMQCHFRRFQIATKGFRTSGTEYQLSLDNRKKIILFQRAEHFWTPMLGKNRTFYPNMRRLSSKRQQKKVYQSDLTKEQCQLLDSILATLEPKKGGAPRKWPLVTIINAIMYVIRSGCQWRMVPSEFPPWQTVYYHYNKWSKMVNIRPTHSLIIFQQSSKVFIQRI